MFTEVPTRGNPVAVVADGDGLDEGEMRAFAAWTNLSEPVFLLTPTDPAADYRVRILTPTSELPFAGHPTLGSGGVLPSSYVAAQGTAMGRIGRAHLAEVDGQVSVGGGTHTVIAGEVGL